MISVLITLAWVMPLAFILSDDGLPLWVFMLLGSWGFLVTDWLVNLIKKWREK